MPAVDVFDDLEAEQERLGVVLRGLGDDAWGRQSGAAGWTVADVVLHLTQSDEFVFAPSVASGPEGAIDRGGFTASSVDELMDELVRNQRAEPPIVLERWESAHRRSVAFLRQADPDSLIPWAAGPMRPRTLATTRLAEYWAHGLDVTGPLGVDFPDEPRLYHVAWLGHRSLPYALALVGEEPHPVRCELTGPDGAVWAFGPADAPSTITGPGADFCRVGARRLAPDQSGLRTGGPHGAVALRALRNYAA